MLVGHHSTGLPLHELEALLNLPLHREPHGPTAAVAILVAFTPRPVLAAGVFALGFVLGCTELHIRGHIDASFSRSPPRADARPRGGAAFASRPPSHSSHRYCNTISYIVNRNSSSISKRFGRILPMNSAMPRGGKREGSGRPRVNPWTPLRRVAQVRATAKEIGTWRKAAKKAGKGFGEWAREKLNNASKHS